MEIFSELAVLRCLSIASDACRGNPRKMTGGTFAVVNGYHLQENRKYWEMLGTVLIVVLLLALLGAWPIWGYSRSWGYTPSGTIGIVLVFFLVLVVVRGM